MKKATHLRDRMIPNIPSTTDALHPMASTLLSNLRFVPCLFALFPALVAGSSLPASPEAYLQQAQLVRQSVDRPWRPEAGQLGNLRHLHIRTRDCVVRIVSGTENRVFPGTRDVIVVERSRVLDDPDPNERLTPRDVVLAPDRAQACPGPGDCGVSVTPAAHAPRIDGAACFTVQLASAHDLLAGGDGLDLVIDRVRQPALRVRINPSTNLRLWFDEIDIGLLSIRANASAHVGGTGRIDFLHAESSNRAIVMYLHEFAARNVGISTTTTDTQWSIRIGEDTTASYYQPARAPGALAAKYAIEIDGDSERLEVPAGQVDPRPLHQSTRDAARLLREQVFRRAGPAPRLPGLDSSLPSAIEAAARLAQTPEQRVANVVARYLPANVRITNVALWKRGGRLEGIAPDAATVKDVQHRLRESGEFTYVSGGGGVRRDSEMAFSTQMYFPCDIPGQPSTCRAGDPRAKGDYSEMQVIETLERLLPPGITLHDASLDDRKIDVTIFTESEADAREALRLLRQANDFFRISTTSVGPADQGKRRRITARMELVCARPSPADGICPSSARLLEELIEGPE